MKKANLINFMIIAIIYLLFYIVDLLISQNNNISVLAIFQGRDLEIVILLYLLFMIPCIIYSTKQVFNLYIKHTRETKLFNSRISLFISSVIVGFSNLYVNAEYYNYFVSIILSYLLYFGLLFLYDYNYVKKSQENKITVNEEVVSDFLELLGGRENIISVNYEQSRLKVELKNIKAVNMIKLKESGAQGAFVAGNKLQAMIGNNAKDLENGIKDYLTKG